MESAGRLWRAPEKFKGISVTHNMTVAEREQCKEAVAEAKAKTAAETSGEWKFVVRGATWRDEALQSEKETTRVIVDENIDFKDSKNGLKIWYKNANGFINKRSELSLLLNNAIEKPNIIAITEVKPKSSKYQLVSSELNLSGYNHFSANIASSVGRGIVIIVDCSLKAIELVIPVDFQEKLFLEITSAKGNVNLQIVQIVQLRTISN